MADRRVRTQEGALLHDLNNIIEKVRNLQLRAYRGAVRTARADAAAPGIYTEPVSVLEVIVPSGRWLANGTATFSVPAPSATVDLSLQIIAADPLTDEEFVGTAYDLPPGQYKASHTSELVITLRCIGDFVADDNVKITLRSVNGTGEPYSLTNLRLTLDPV